jgi:hypothetical protein
MNLVPRFRKKSVQFTLLRKFIEVKKQIKLSIKLSLLPELKLHNAEHYSTFYK